MSTDEPPDVLVPDLIEPVIGYRQWRLAGEGLRSIGCDEMWRGPTLVARCGVAGHPREPAPVSACTCGVHAWYAPCPRAASAPTREYVSGAVVLWGAIELHQSGMRAQHCRIVALELPVSRWGKRDRLVAVAERFGVPAAGHREVAAIARRCGRPVPAGLRPPGSWRGPYGVTLRMAHLRPLY